MPDNKTDLLLLQTAMRHQRNRYTILAILMMLVGITCCFLVNILNPALTILLICIGLTLVLLGFKVLYDQLKTWDLYKHELMRTIQQHPKDIVWIYSIITKLSPFGINLYSSGTLFFKLANGEEITLDASAKSLKLISSSLNNVLPHATFGYTQEREQWYMASPLLLLKNGEKKDR